MQLSLLASTQWWLKPFFVGSYCFFIRSCFLQQKKHDLARSGFQFCHPRSRFWEPKLKTWSCQIMFYVINPEVMEVLGKFGNFGKFWKILGKFWYKFSNFGKFRIVISKVGVKLWRREGYVRSKMHFFVPSSPLEPLRSIFLTQNRCLIDSPIWGYRKFCFLPKLGFLFQMIFFHFGRNICISGPFWCYARPKIIGNKMPSWFFDMWVPKLCSF